MWPTNKKHWTHSRKDRLTRTQEALLPQICEKWRRITLSSEPADRKKAQEAVKAAYKVCNRKPPQQFIWLDSIFQFSNDLHTKLGVLTFPDRLSGGRDYFMYLGAVRFYKEAVVKEVRRVISESVPDVISPLNLLPRNENWVQDWVRNIERNRLGSDHAHALALADFFATSRHWPFNDFSPVLEHCAGIWTYQNAVVFLERPRLLNLDRQNRIHSLSGPAIEYRDGSVIHAIHGIRLDRKWIDTPADQIDISEIMREENAQIRSAIIAKYGFERLLKNVRYRTVSKHKGNSLIEFAFVRGGHRASLRLRALHLKWRDKTGQKESILPVPRTLRQFGEERPANIDSCEQVRRWTLGWSKEAIAVAET